MRSRSTKAVRDPCRSAAALASARQRWRRIYAREEIEYRIEWLDGWQPEAFNLEDVRKPFER